MWDSNEMFTEFGKTELKAEVDLWIIRSSITRNIVQKQDSKSVDTIRQNCKWGQKLYSHWKSEG
jgi:GTP:adenosylcobinamide-phosphate guanylyltransferase